MKVIYFDCFAGIAGNMILGALVDAGLPIEKLQSELAKLNVDGFKLETEKVVSHGITGTLVNVITEEQSSHRHLHHIVDIIDGSSLSDTVKSRAKAIFKKLAEAEAKIHNTTPEKIHFHEVGALDAIVDIVGASIGLELLGIEKVYSSKINTGSGFVECQHGTMPVPAPATLELLQGAPIYSSGIEKELTTPTGAAILAVVCDSFGDMPEIEISSTGYGSGTHELPIPNLLRVSIGEMSAKYATETVTMIETNIDDMNPQIFDYLIEKLLEAGALDVFTTPINMKKNRPSTLLSVLSPDSLVSKMAEIIFQETTSIGVRYRRYNRIKLDREIRTIETEHGKVRVKISYKGDRIYNISPEYDDCKAVAEKSGLPLIQLMDDMKAIARDQFGQ